VLPTSVTRWIGFQTNKDAPPAATFAAGAIFQLAPFVNVVLLFALRGELRLISLDDDDDDDDEGDGGDEIEMM
jgi:hypothetical protein